MLTSRSKLSIVAISMLGLAGWSAAGPGAQDAASPAAGRGAAPRQAQAGAAKQPEVVLLGDGRIVTGIVSEKNGMVIVTQPIGTMRFPSRKVERVLASMKEVYNYKLEQFPENDLEERINLARWCLSQKMEPEAREQLGAVLEQSPNHGQAKAMLLSMDQEQARLAMRGRDPAVRQTAAEEVRRTPGDRPGVLDASIYSGALRGMGIPDYPVIFDLPRALAVKRFDEFGRYVHPLLQTYCARCHNDRYEGSFQLISFKHQIDRTPAALLANLDATLRLIDRQQPAHSELLSSALRPHGHGPNPRPIFRGSNDRDYQILASWITRLQGRNRSEGVIPTSLTSERADSGETFATQRGASADDSVPAGPPVKPFVTGPVEYKSLPPMRAIPGQSGMVADTNTNPDEFPIPLAAGGRTRGPATPARPRTATPTPAPGTLPPLPGAAAERSAHARGIVTPDPDADSSEADAADADPKKPSKPIKFDPKLLQKALQTKNQYRPQPGTSP